MQIYIVEFITRAHSSGYENRSKKVFKTLEGASKYMIRIFKSYAIDDDPEDLFTDETLETQAPVPTAELAQELFSPTALQTFLETSPSTTIYGPWSEFCCLVPFEMTIESDELIK